MKKLLRRLPENPIMISERKIVEHYPDMVATMKKFRPVVETVLSSRKLVEKKDSVEIPTYMKTTEGVDELTYTKFRIMWGVQGCIVLKYFGANEDTAEKFGINRINAWSMVVEPSTGVTLGFVSGNYVTEIRTALSAVIGNRHLIEKTNHFQTRKKESEKNQNDYRVAILGFGRIGQAIACALETEEKKPAEVIVISKDADLQKRVEKIQQNVTYKISFLQTKDTGLEDGIDLNKTLAGTEIIFDCIALSRPKPIITMPDIRDAKIYIDISKQTISPDAVARFDLAFFDSMRLARHLPSIAGLVFGVYKNTDPLISRAFGINQLTFNEMPGLGNKRIIYTIMGVPSVDAAITQQIFTELTGITKDRFLDAALSIAKPEKG